MNPTSNPSAASRPDDQKRVPGPGLAGWKTAAQAALIIACLSLFGLAILYAPFPDAKGLCIGAEDPRALPTTVVSVEMLRSRCCPGPAEQAHLDWAMPPTAVDTILDLIKFGDFRTAGTPADEAGANQVANQMANQMANQINKHGQGSPAHGTLPAPCAWDPACLALPHGPDNHEPRGNEICLPADELTGGAKSNSGRFDVNELDRKRAAPAIGHAE